MVSERDHELMQQAIDGVIGPDDRARLQVLLDRDAEARALYAQLQATCTALASVRPLEPPKTLRPGVMRAIAELPAPARSLRLRFVRETIHTVIDTIQHPFTKEAVMSPTTGSRKYGWLITGAVVAIVAVVYFSFYYPPAPAEDAQGTIGAAQKYRSEQITDKDVMIGSTTASPFEEQIMADANTMQELGRAAAALSKTSSDFAAKAGLDRAVAADLSRAANALERAVALGKTAGLQKTLAADLLERMRGLDRNASAALGAQAVLEKSAAADLQRAAGAIELNAAAVSLDMNARSLDRTAGLERTSIADLQRAASTLDRAAGLYRAGKIERTAVNDLVGATAKFEKSAAPALEAKSALAAKAVSELNATAAELGRSAINLQRSFPAEMRSTLDQKQVLEQKSTLDKNAPAEH